jgi:hypothetical protein
MFRIASKPKGAFAVFYRAGHYGRNFFAATTNITNPAAIIDYGGPSSPTTNNRAIQRITFDWLLTFWKSERHGALIHFPPHIRCSSLAAGCSGAAMFWKLARV